MLPAELLVPRKGAFLLREANPCPPFGKIAASFPRDQEGLNNRLEGECMPSPKLMNWLLSGIEHSARTGAGAAASLAIARLLRMPEAYWAPITTLVVMQSSLGAAWTISKSRFIGTVLGAVSGGLLATYFGPGVIVLGLVIFALGLICAIFRLDQSAYRFAGITAAIVMLASRGNAPWLTAFNRFVEVFLGISVALVLSALWPEHEFAGGKGARVIRSKRKQS